MNLNPIYLRQEELHVEVPPIISVVGVGGIGSWVAIIGAMLGVEEIHLFDSDSLEIHNLNRLPYTEEDVGKPKTLVCKEFINRIRPDTLVFTHPAIDEFSLDSLRGFVFICTDTVRSQDMVRKYCVEEDLPFLHLGYDGRHFTLEGMKELSVWEIEGTQDGYRVVPSYVITPLFVTLLAYLSIDLGLTPEEIYISDSLREVFWKLLVK